MEKDYIKIFNEIINNTSNDESKDIPVVPQWYLSLSEHRVECPTCQHIPADLTDYKVDYVTREGHWIYKDRCPYCGQAIKWDWEEIDKKAKKSKMYREWELKNKIEM